MTKTQIRDRLLKRLEQELLGPKDGSNEVFQELPTNRYILGILFPASTSVDSDQEDESNSDADVTDDASSVSFLPVSDRMCPSSLGMSFVIDKKSKEFDVEINWAFYSQHAKGAVFKRNECTHKSTIRLNDSTDHYVISQATPKLGIYARRYDDSPSPGLMTLSLFLVNDDLNCIEKNELNKRCVFTPSIEVTSTSCAILARENLLSVSDESDLKSLRLLYHNRHEFAVGHSCSVEWDGVVGKRCKIVRTTFIPRYLQQPTDLREKNPFLLMELLSEPRNKSDFIPILRKLSDDYQNWIEETFKATDSQLQSDFSDTLDDHESDCKESLERIREGIKMIDSDKQTLEAFCFMNKAMYRQRIQSVVSDEYRKRYSYYKDKGIYPDVKSLIASGTVRPDKGSPLWRPFQLAFILETLPSIVDPTRPDRRHIDLLWIPTGGGKTEAYLGLAAFAIALRRLRNFGKPFYGYLGVSVLMRYTLRLLTIQQFQRAASLISACETIRVENKAIWGEEPILAALFVGDSTTPNDIGDKNDYDLGIEGDEDKKRTASFAVEYWRRQHRKSEGTNPFIITNCPWCGEPLDAHSYEIDWDSKFLVTHCLRPGCPFNSKLEIPALTVDQNIFSRLPALVIATVDKFAQLPFKPKYGMLFGHVNQYCHRCGFVNPEDSSHATHRKAEPPYKIPGKMISPLDLIIQDELHLINGPLGSMVGIYETTIDYLSYRWIDEKHRVPPKYIASTATIRRAGVQSWNLYRRNLRRFPAAGTDFNDSFFVRELVDHNDMAKMYIGIFPSAIGLKSAMIRTLATLLAETSAIKNGAPAIPLEEWDDYWTIVSYFNSIRELGSAKTTMEDDVQGRVGKHVRHLKIRELTSRIDSQMLPEILNELSLQATNTDAIDILACSNMFSVGVDVQRLGLMVMNNQPKSVSEYIQSTGRVGRTGTGLAVVLFNWARPRDQSHFERFFDFHNRIQSHVEAMTVTPFSQGVMDRALHAQYVAAMRIIYDSEIIRNKDAIRFTPAHRGSDISKDISSWLIQCGRLIDKDIVGDLQGQLNQFIDVWIDEATMDSLEYQIPHPNYSTNGKRFLMKSSPKQMPGVSGPKILTPSSLRNIEEEIALHKVWGLRWR